MDVKNNFISVVSLGCFNPAILSPQFLKEKCGFESHSEPKGRTTPVVTGWDYGSVSFLLDLERFQIKHSDVTDFLNTAIVTMMLKYLAVLEYTPVDAVGLNLNYDLRTVNPGKFLNRLHQSQKELIQFMKLNESVITQRHRRRVKGAEQLIEMDVSGGINENTLERLNATSHDSSVRINYNHEMRNLRERRDLLAKIEPNWKAFVEKDKLIRDEYFKEPK